MRSVAEFYQDCLSAVGQQPPLDQLLADAADCVLAEDVIAPFDHPVADVAAADGYAARSADLEGASPSTPVRLMVTAEVTAGDVDPEALVDGGAVRIASGAPMPIGADCVVGLEFTDLGTRDVAVNTHVAVGELVRTRGEDLKAGAVVLQRGTRLGAPQIAALAAVGRERVVVHPKPRVIIISVGDELIEPGSPARPGTVFDANGHALAAAAREAGADVFRVTAVPDDPRRLQDLMEDQLMRADLVLTTGGISFGSGNTVREVLTTLGDVRFDRVAAWPGNMLGTGVIGEESGRPTPVFALPGDPVSAQVAFEVYVRPALRKMQGWARLSRSAVKASVNRGWYSPRGRREFVRVKLTGDPREGYEATVMGQPDALWLSAMAASNALAIVPEDVTDVSVGDQLTCMLLD